MSYIKTRYILIKYELFYKVLNTFRIYITLSKRYFLRRRYKESILIIGPLG